MPRKRRNFEKEVANRYMIEKVLGEGGFCIVFLATDKTTNKHVAVKRMDKTKPLYKNFRNPKAMEKLDKLMYREADCMRELEHENIIKLIDFIDNGHHIYIVLDFAEGGELNRKLMQIGRFKETYVVIIIRQVVSAIGFMHDRGYVHRDIKAENVLFKYRNQTHILVTDFGLSKQTHGILHTNCGTLCYSAPELLANKNTRAGYDKKVDNWAIGVLAYLLLAGYLPFDDPLHKEQKIVMKIMRGKISFPYNQWGAVSHGAKDFVLRLLEHNPYNRMSMGSAKAHKFINDGTVPLAVEEATTIEVAKPKPMNAKFCSGPKLSQLRILIVFIVTALFVVTKIENDI